MLILPAASLQNTIPMPIKNSIGTVLPPVISGRTPKNSWSRLMAGITFKAGHDQRQENQLLRKRRAVILKERYPFEHSGSDGLS